MDKNEEVKKKLKKILKCGLRRSQSSLKTKGIKTGGERMRRIASEMPEIEIKTKTKKSKNQPERCPCCFSALETEHTKNLKGERVPAKYICPKCGFRCNAQSPAPAKYEFLLRK